MAKSKRAKRTRTADEFDAIRLAAQLRYPRWSGNVYVWEPESIASARDAQMRGEFRRASKMADSMLSGGWIFAALVNRLAPPQGLTCQLEPPSETTKAARVLDEADALFGAEGIAVARSTVWNLHRCLVMHGVAFATNVITPRDDGSRVDIEVRYWPIEYVRWDPVCRSYQALTESGGWENICHGDGRWVVVRKADVEPHKEGAIIPLAVNWLETGLGKRDRAMASTSHGSPKFVGTLPPNIAIDSPEGQQFMALLANLHEALPYCIAPNGATVQLLASASSAWQIWSEISKDGTAEAAQVLLGNDGLVRSAGGNYIKDGYVWGVRNDLVESDLRCLEHAIFTGTIQVWAALNFGTSDLAPYRRWLMPDVDEDQRRESLASRTKAYHEALKGYRDAGMVVDQAFADSLAKEFGVRAGALAVTTSGGASGTPAPAPTSPKAARLVSLPASTRTAARSP